MNILMPTDFSENSWNAISYALSFFQNVYTNFYFLNIENNDWEETDVTVAQSTATNTQKSFQILLARLAKERKNNKHQFFTATESGNFIEAIRQQVTDKEVDFIVMGTQGASGYKEATVGSHSTDVITRVKCPVLVIPEDARYTEPKRITFPTDFNISYKIVINKWDINLDLSKKVEKEFKEKMLGKISYDKRIFKAISQLKPILETDLRAKKEIKDIFSKLLPLVS